MEYKSDVPHGAIAAVLYDSAVVGGMRRMHIYTPPGYENSRARYQCSIFCMAAAIQMIRGQQWAVPGPFWTI